MITKNVKVWLGQNESNVYLPVSQFDSMWEFVFTIYNGPTEWQIPIGAEIVLNGLKPDGNTFSFRGTLSSNKVSVPGDVQMTAVAGNTKCELSVMSGGRVVGTANFTLVVEAAPKAPGDISSETTLPAYAEILEEIAEILAGGRGGGGGTIIVDDSLSTSSINPVQNRVITNTINNLQDTKWSKGPFIYFDKLTLVDPIFGGSYDVPFLVNGCIGESYLPLASQSSNGAMSFLDKTKLDGLGPITIDSSLSSSSENPVQNKVIYFALLNKADLSSVHSIPSGGSVGQVLKKTGISDYAVSWGNSGDNIFYAEYDVTSQIDLEEAYNDGKFIITVYSDSDGEIFLPLVAVSANGSGHDFYFNVYFAGTEYSATMSGDLWSWDVNSVSPIGSLGDPDSGSDQ